MPAPPTIQRAGMLALALPDCAAVEVALAAELEAEVEDAGLVAELAGAEATFATAPAAEAVELADEDLDVVDGGIQVGFCQDRRFSYGGYQLHSCHR